MKLYRIVPNSILTDSTSTDIINKINIEDIYYKMGYASFSDRHRKHSFNSLNCNNLQGKYFYLFPEDAILHGKRLMSGYHRLDTNIWTILEYDVPTDIVMKHLGYGNYTDSICPLLLIESFIEKNDLGEKAVLSDEIDPNSLLKCLTEVIMESLDILKEYENYSLSDIVLCQNAFSEIDFSVAMDEESIRNILLNSDFYNTFVKQHYILVASDYITSKMLVVNNRFFRKLGTRVKICEYYKNLGLIECEFSDERQEYKNELLSLIRDDNQDKEIIKRLLKEKKCI